MKNKLLHRLSRHFSFIALAALIAVCGFFAGCDIDRLMEENDVFNSIAALTDYLAEQPNNDADNPIGIKLSINLGFMTQAGSGWRQLLDAIAAAERFVNLDLSDCTMSGTEFNADDNISTGKNRIVSIVLPDAARNVTGIGSILPYFIHFTNLRTVSGTGITSISAFAFYGCTGLTKASFPAAETIGDSAFRDCTSLTQASFPAATSIGSQAFYGCTGLTEVSFPAADSIGNTAFYGCTELTQASFPAAASIGISAFRDCTSLTQVSFTAAASIGNLAFSGCTGLTSFNLTGTGALSVMEGGRALVRNGTELVAYPAAAGSITLTGITSIGSSVFEGCTSLTQVNIPSVTSIGGSAFFGCTGLTSVTLGTITSVNFSSTSFPGNLRTVYFAAGGGAGTYVTDNPGSSPTWRK